MLEMGYLAIPEGLYHVRIDQVLYRFVSWYFSFVENRLFDLAYQHRVLCFPPADHKEPVLSSCVCSNDCRESISSAAV